ncbi:hypothetical protein CAL29_28230 [Bordetella genomosp. 10]|uniref:Uncharacterized protein n=1 Tax=Bordetella genomosp. 10 TaxID=1416804 RepID=A0A261S4P9_9BORD|nr:hypothetical protein [Bordetella genomosp. 10]OZI31760.1 hypothetical protein CAL29_28230 [Bordetella genomosp. 10]
MNKATVTMLPTAAAAPVVNPRTPGRRPKSIASLQAARAARQDQALPDEVRTVEPPPVVKGKFNYPKSLLRQAYFCQGGNGTWRTPDMHLRMLVSDKFLSPLGALLDQMEQEGHNVSGARAEWMAFRELAKGLECKIVALEQFVSNMRFADSPLVTAFLQHGRDGL